MMERRRKPAKTIKDIFEPSNYYPVTSRYSQLIGLYISIAVMNCTVGGWSQYNLGYSDFEMSKIFSLYFLKNMIRILINYKWISLFRTQIFWVNVQCWNIIKYNRILFQQEISQICRKNLENKQLNFHSILHIPLVNFTNKKVCKDFAKFRLRNVCGHPWLNWNEQFL